MHIPVMLIFMSLLLVSCGNTTEPREPVFKVQDFDVDRSSDHNFVPKRGYVDKPEVAARIAEAVAVGFYGRNQIEAQRPYLVKRLDDRWVVRGSWLHGSGVKGGVFEIEVSSSDARILRMTHGK
jgi:hypothetical protein